MRLCTSAPLHLCTSYRMVTARVRMVTGPTTPRLTVTFCGAMLGGMRCGAAASSTLERRRCGNPLQPYVIEAATVGSGGCNRRQRRLQPQAAETATACGGGCNQAATCLCPKPVTLACNTCLQLRTGAALPPLQHRVVCHCLWCRRLPFRHCLHSTLPPSLTRRPRRLRRIRRLLWTLVRGHMPTYLPAYPLTSNLPTCLPAYLPTH